MTHRFSRRAFLLTGAAATLAAAQPLWANPPLTSLRPAARGADFGRKTLPSAEALIEAARLDGAVGFAVADVATGETLEERQGATGLPPASVAKALTAAYALHHLGPAHHFVTRLVATGPVTDGVVAGDLALVGGGDPVLETDNLAALAADLKAAGIREVKGRFLLWDGALPYLRTIDAGQPDHVGYSPAISSLNLNYNRVHFEWRRGGKGYDVTMDARSATHRPDVSMARMSVVARSTPVYTYADAGGHDDWTVAKGALGKGGARWLPVRKPALYAGEVFQTFARAHGIVLKTPAMAETEPKGATLATHESPPLRIILRDMLKYSTNLTAEVVGLSTTKAIGGVAETLAQSAAAMNAWAISDLGLKSAALVDHSGLGDASRISAADMCRALVAVRGRMGLKPLLKKIKMRDDARNLVEDHPLSVHAKTGTLNFVSGLGGFIDLPDGRELAFAIFAADIERRAGLTKAERERPEGARSWNVRAKKLQQALIDRWGVMYAS
ncbi:D-alanyl-D-alanine carboxypeptidase/D-alanyl-D-alanine-endopeptidase [Aestuariicoccus sp. MJ-SS9]|uniref:D-alanyl-D-alanine carboxypeptidase/D-alanyl-D-alanine endopeptidase n=1 Tax=Aestuariicoccus sp. MJ-SS9 TaxID=3079855 RepID=UPI00290A391E|nr:D-alanyl-D-alanine carboxypeptidase/D-alanyl-D-alanine-endopeptidase [Aestuariicoccus sp. MJ-SS9]MDU8912419.1 D-alanyl-D-alanine carboxypeptidase/D-alanyl-D-alanine-endopeptidase [Aestuariicoccus sp. MJ-SS9]